MGIPNRHLGSCIALSHLDVHHRAGHRHMADAGSSSSVVAGFQSLVDVDAKPRLKRFRVFTSSVFGVFRVFRVHPDDRVKGQCLSLVANQFLYPMPW